MIGLVPAHTVSPLIKVNLIPDLDSRAGKHRYYVVLPRRTWVLGYFCIRMYGVNSCERAQASYYTAPGCKILCSHAAVQPCCLAIIPSCNHTVLQSCCYTLLTQSNFAIALLALSFNNDIRSGSSNCPFRTTSIPRLCGFMLFSLSAAWLFRSVRMTWYTQPMHYGAEKRPNDHSWWQVCSHMHCLRPRRSWQCDMQNTGNGGYYTYTTSEDGVLIPLLSM